jgi:hypothetical protein
MLPILPIMPVFKHGHIMVVDKAADGVLQMGDGFEHASAALMHESVVRVKWKTP